MIRTSRIAHKNHSPTTVLLVHVEQRSTCLENYNKEVENEIGRYVRRISALRRVSISADMYRHMYMFAENPICSLKQLFTVTSVDRRYFCSQKGKWIGGIAENAAAVYKSAAVTHSPINFGGRSIDHNVLFCSLVFLPAAFDSIRGCGESIYLSRCHEPPVMDGGCSLTLTPKGEAVPRTYPVPATLCF